MAIEYVGGQTQLLGTSNTTITFSLTGGISATPASGDVVIVTIGVASTSDRAIGVLSPAGYTELNQVYVNDVFDTNMSTSWKRMGTTPDTSVTVTGATAAEGRTAVIQVFRGVDATQPFDTSIATSTAPNTAIVNPSAVSPVTPGSIIVISGAAAHNQFALGTFSAPYLSNFITDTNNTTNDLTVGMGYVAWTSGVYDPAAWTFGGTNSADFSNASITMALRPAAEATNVTAINITVAAPTLYTATIAQTHVLTGVNIEIASPEFDTATLIAMSILNAVGITSDTPTIDASTLAQTPILASVAITAGTPTLDTPTLTAVAGMNSLTALSITTGATTVDTATVAQTHALSNTNIVTGTPTVGVTTIHVTSVLVSTNVETGTPTLGLPDLIDYTLLAAASLTTGSPTVDASTISQIHVFTSVPITTGIPELPLAIAFSQGAFNAGYERKRTVWVRAESRTVMVSKEALPTVVTAERENRTATIQ